MYELQNNKCVICGNVIPQATGVSQGFCDNCGAPICATCSSLHVFHTTGITNLGRTGFVRLCNHCRDVLHATRINEHPYIG